MLVSELIEKLKEEMNEVGDVEVLITFGQISSLTGVVTHIGTTIKHDNTKVIALTNMAITRGIIEAMKKN